VKELMIGHGEYTSGELIAGQTVLENFPINEDRSLVQEKCDYKAQ
jgi:hypothetical protein